MPHYAASELGLHCLHMSPKQLSGLKWVNVYRYISKGRDHYVMGMDFERLAQFFAKIP